MKSCVDSLIAIVGWSWSGCEIVLAFPCIKDSSLNRNGCGCWKNLIAHFSSYVS